MRNFTHYELKVLIRNELKFLIQEDAKSELSIVYIAARCADILKYVDEYHAIDEDKNE